MFKNIRPKTPGQRHLTQPMDDTLTTVAPGKRAKVKPLKRLMGPKNRTGGRNHHGHITSRHRGGGAKRQYRFIDFTRDKDGVPAKVASIEYDPNRSARIALINYVDGEKRYILAPQGLKVGDEIVSGPKTPYTVGCCMEMGQMPMGAMVHNVELVPGRGGRLVRSAGRAAQLMARAEGYVTLRLPSGEMRQVHERCRATFGEVSNPNHNLRVEGKAGRVRWRGVRPQTRGTAMNPVDHPHGGGEGKHNGYIPQTPWAMYTKGFKTRKKRKASTRFIVKDRRKP
jgi:large subunit ribosomal protein L2